MAWSLGQRVGDRGTQLTGVTLVAVGAGELQPQSHTVAVADGCGRPHVLVEADRSAVQAVRVVVDRQLVGDTVEGEPSVGDPVGVPAGDAAEVRALRHVVGQVVEPECHVGPVTVPVGGLDALQDAAVGENPDAHSVVGEGVPIDGYAADRPPRLFGDRRGTVGVRGGRTDQPDAGGHERHRAEPDRGPADGDPVHGASPLSNGATLLCVACRVTGGRARGGGVSTPRRGRERLAARPPERDPAGHMGETRSADSTLQLAHKRCQHR